MSKLKIIYLYLDRPSTTRPTTMLRSRVKMYKKSIPSVKMVQHGHGRVSHFSDGNSVNLRVNTNLDKDLTDKVR